MCSSSVTLRFSILPVVWFSDNRLLECSLLRMPLISIISMSSSMGYGKKTVKLMMYQKYIILYSGESAASDACDKAKL